MNLKISLMMLMILVSLTTFAQYPTTKKINGRQVVIMTAPQAEQIDSQFETLNDSVTKLNSLINLKNKEIRIVDSKRQKTVDTLQAFKFNLASANLVIDSLKRETLRIQKLEYIEKRTRQRVGIGLGAVTITWTLFFVLMVKN